ncbi:MAG: GGDEF domain-containing protein [Candidatus Omnitrophica bacterium]|nr:GGDEF domain-containing protein [Candidatus Omnitrophota bacterium]
MTFLRRALLLLFVLSVVVAAFIVIGNAELLDRLKDYLWTIHLSLPLTVGFDAFLVVLTVSSIFVCFLLLSLCVTLVVAVAARLALRKQHELLQVASTKRDADRLKEEHHRHYEQLALMEQTLAQRLDKRVLVQTIVETASRVTSSVQANSVASLWLLHYETETFRFEMGRYCDETLFQKTEFQPNEQPFAHVVATQKPSMVSQLTDEMVAAFLAPDKVRQLRSATAAMLIPFVIEGRVLGVLVIFCHADMLKQYEEQRAFYAAIWGELTLAGVIAIQGAVTILDRLTGVHTREYFMNRLVQEIERANRYQLPVSLLMVDIDNFKLVNDTLGHPQGDAVLKIVAKILKKEVRAIDLVGRYGGEEFVVMLPETGFGEGGAAASGAMVVAERIRKSVDEEFHGLQKPLNLTVSIGVSVRRFPEGRETDYRDLIRMADEQLYRAKTTGKNKVCVLSPETPEAIL